MAEFVRKIKLRAFFNTQPALVIQPDDTGLKKKSSFVPPQNQLPVEILAFEKAVMKDIEDLDPKDLSTFHNLTTGEHKALMELKNNDSVIIKPADKGGAVVIMDIIDYRAECLRLLSDERTYQKLAQDPSQGLKSEIDILVEEAENCNWISRKEADFLRQSKPRTPYFYILPKIHKNTLPPPGRPIVSGIGSLLEPLSTFVDAFLKPIVQKTTTYLRDTTDVLRLLSELPFNPQQSLLLSLDVESLYTNIPQEASLTVIEDILQQMEWPFHTPIHFVMTCATLALKRNFFEFEGQLFLQSHGTSMGSTFAPSVAGLYVHHVEVKKILTANNPFFTSVALWKRYIDDVFVIWHGTEVEALSFVDWLNNQDPYLHFTHNMSREHLVFLDLDIKATEGRLKTTTHFKPTARNTLLHFQSFHPRTLRENLPYGQFLRLRRNCSDLNDYKRQAYSLSTKLTERGYPHRIVAQAQKRARNNNREALLDAPIRQKEDQPLVCVTTHNIATNRVKRIVNRNWRILNSGGLNVEKPIFSNKRSTTLRDLLVHTRPKGEAMVPRTLWDLPPVAGHFPCGNCAACPYTSKSQRLDLGLRNPWVQKSFTNCNSMRVIYMITCPCNLRYIGMTERKVKVRILEHRSNIRCLRKTTKMCTHFTTKHHSPDDVRWTVLEQVKSSNLLYEKEQRWVHRLCTSSQGLNEEIQWTHFFN